MEEKYRYDHEMPLRVDEWSPRTYVEPFHWHASLEIGLCLSGKGWFYFGDKTYEVTAGDIFVVNNLERHIAQSDAADPSNYLFVNFRPELFGDGDKELLLPFVYNPKKFTNKMAKELPAARQIGELIRQMRTEQLNKQAGHRQIMKGLLLQICALLFRHYSNHPGYKEQFNQIYEQYMRLQPALAFLRDRFRENIGLEDMAKQLKLSCSRARHLFKHIMGEGFKEYLTQLRINEAKKLLSGTERTVTEICMSCGFQNISPFYRAFRQIVGMTPQAYREQSALFILRTEQDEEPVFPE
ncbi:AraC family transcriptional regulator [Paenibacillus sp. 32O-W]|uniref:HTH araC/xylS-type domain-containing protein n=1 Tax=Paenibacillus cisolokensis TaxID=1658519 RepID=A0ABQ4N1L7_9BACL|nr:MULTISPECIES: AraC family transcriptional regulator [Paenibacillus]ALS27864.1 AraC family transcriptional regulator [Paenibacillus sp. 32O-W]GIQ62060.1 hypothetical protein PACILC2_06280 [Paenibacillus cisolokensis]